MAPIQRPASLVAACFIAASAGVSVLAQTSTAMAAGQLPSLPVTRLEDHSQAQDLDAPRRLSLAFAEPAPIQDVLLLLVRGTPFSIALDSSLQGTFIGELKEVTLRQALESVLSPRELAYSVDGTLIRVFPRRTETRLFDLNFLNVRRDWRRTVATADGTAFTGTAESDIFADVEKGIGALLSGDGRSHVDRRGGLAEVTDYPDRLDHIGLYIEALHVRASRQIRLRASVIEVTPKSGTAVDWRAVRASLGLPADGSTSGVAASAADVVKALASQGDVRTIALPDVTAMNNEATILRTGTPDVSWMTLTVVPQISDDGIVQLSVSPSWAERAGERHVKNGATEGTMRVSEVDTVGRVADGNTLFLAGMLKTGETVKPATGFAGFFGAQQHDPATRELVVLVTPTIVSTGTATAGQR